MKSGWRLGLQKYLDTRLTARTPKNISRGRVERPISRLQFVPLQSRALNQLGHREKIRKAHRSWTCLAGVSLVIGASIAGILLPQHAGSVKCALLICVSLCYRKATCWLANSVGLEGV